MGNFKCHKQQQREEIHKNGEKKQHKSRDIEVKYIRTHSDNE